MAKRPTIVDLAEAAGVSVATVDRVLNGRHAVRAGTAERVLAAAEALGYHATALMERRVRRAVPERRFGFLLQKRSDAFYRQFAADIEAACAAATEVRVVPVVAFVDELSPGALAEAMRRLGAGVDALSVVSIEHPHIDAAIADLKADGVPVFALLTDLTAEARAGYIGRDNRKEGRTAAWMIEHTARAPGEIGIIVGSHRYLCQETAEISFRAYFREHASGFRLLEPLVNLEDVRVAYEATLDLLARRRGMVGLYLCGGGTDGVIRAVREEAPEGLAIVCYELTPTTRAALVDGVITAVIGTPTARLAQSAVAAMTKATAGKGLGRTAGVAPSDLPFVHAVHPFDLFIRENV